MKKKTKTWLELAIKEYKGYTPEELRKSSHTIFGQIIRKTGKVLV